jgi:hypothetical protein
MEALTRRPLDFSRLELEDSLATLGLKGFKTATSKVREITFVPRGHGEAMNAGRGVSGKLAVEA